MSKTNGHVPKGSRAVEALTLVQRDIQRMRREAQSLYFDLPYPPTANTHWRIGGGRMFLSPKTRDWRKKSSIAVNEQGRPLQAISTPIRMELLVHPPDRRRRDVANCEKEIADLLQREGVIEDDFLIDELFIKRMPVCGESPRVEVLIIPL